MARSFTPTDRIVTSGASIERFPTGTYPFTYACWFRAHSAHTARVFGTCVPAQSNVNHVTHNITNGSLVRFTIKDSVATHYYASWPVYTPNQWCHVAAVCPTNLTRTVYRDGQYPVVSPGAKSPSWSAVCYGHIGDSTPSSFFDGDVAECAIWNAALDAGEIWALWRGAAPSMIRPGKLVYYQDLINGMPHPGVSGDGHNITGTAIVPHLRQYYPVPVSWKYKGLPLPPAYPPPLLIEAESSKAKIRKQPESPKAKIVDLGPSKAKIPRDS